MSIFDSTRKLASYLYDTFLDVVRETVFSEYEDRGYREEDQPVYFHSFAWERNPDEIRKGILGHLKLSNQRDPLQADEVVIVTNEHCLRVNPSRLSNLELGTPLIVDLRRTIDGSVYVEDLAIDGAAAPAVTGPGFPTL